MIDPRARRLLDLLAANRGPSAAFDPAAQRAGLDQLAALAAGPPPDVAEVRDMPLGATSGRLYDPAPGEISGGVVFLHGGGWVAGSLATHDPFCRALAAHSGCKLLAVHYRLAPEHPYPAAILDGLEALNWMASQGGPLGIDPARLAVAGDSAGGALAAAICAQARGAGGPPIALQVLICPILELAGRLASRRAFADGYFIDAEAFARDRSAYLGGADPDDPDVSPLLRPNLAGIPPTQVHTAEYDPFRDEGEAYVDRLQAAGVDARLTRHAGMIHYFYALAGAIPTGRAAVARMGGDIRDALAEAKA